MSGKMRMVQRPRIRTRLSKKMAIKVAIISFATLTVTLGVLLNFSSIVPGVAAVSGDYRSVATGNWNSTDTWENYNGTSWVAATATPTSSDGVITIQSGHTVTVTANVTVDQVVINSTGQLTLNSGKTVTLANGSGTDLDVTGTIRVNDNSKISRSSGATVVFNANSVFEMNWSVTALTGGVIPTATWDATSTVKIIGITTITGNSDFGQQQHLGNVIYNCPGQTSTFNLYYTFMSNDVSGDLSLQGNFTIVSTGTGTLQTGTVTPSNQQINGNFTIQGGTLCTTNSGNRVLNIDGNFSMTGGTWHFTDGGGNYTLNAKGGFNYTGGTIDKSSTGICSIVFEGTGTQNYNLSGNNFSIPVNFTVNSGSILDMGTSILSGSGTFTLSGGGVLIIGSPAGITSSGATGNIQVTGTRTYSTTANYTYAGTAAQVTGNGLPSTISNLTINNSSGVALSAEVTVSGTLTLTSGKITTGSYELKTTNTSTSSIAGYSSSNYVSGNLRRSVAASGAYDFPVGISGNYQLVTVTLSSMTGFTNILGFFTNANPIEASYPLTDLTVDGTPIIDMLNYGYWTLTPNSAMTGGTYTVTLNEKGHTNPGTSPMEYCVLKRANSSSYWQSTGTHDNFTQSESGGVASVTRSGLTSFSNFGIGKGNGPLPVQLISFDAKPVENNVNCAWQTAAEINNDYFTIERSADGKQFSELTRVAGVGTSTAIHKYSYTDQNPLGGTSYYRLKQTDFNGKTETFKIVPVINKEKHAEVSKIRVSPNPFTESFIAEFKSSVKEDVQIEILNANGIIVYTEKIMTREGTNLYRFSNPLSVKSGTYMLRVANGTSVLASAKIIKK